MRSSLSTLLTPFRRHYSHLASYQVKPTALCHWAKNNNRTMFIVLSSVAKTLQEFAQVTWTNMGCQAANSDCSLLLSHKADTHFTVARRLEGWINRLRNWSRCSQCQKLHIAVVFRENSTCQQCRFDPGTARATVRQVLVTRPLQPAVLIYLLYGKV